MGGGKQIGPALFVVAGGAMGDAMRREAVAQWVKAELGRRVVAVADSVKRGCVGGGKRGELGVGGGEGEGNDVTRYEA